MFIETTFMRYGHGKASIIGKTWAFRLHVCGQLLEDLSTLRYNERPSSIKITPGHMRLALDDVMGRYKSVVPEYRYKYGYKVTP